MEELIKEMFPKTTEAQREMLTTYAEMHAEFDISLDLDMDVKVDSSLPQCLMILNDLFTEFPELEISKNKFKGHEDKTISASVTHDIISSLLEILPEDIVMDQINSMVKTMIFEELKKQLTGSDEKRLGYGKKPLILRAEMIAEKTMPPRLNIITQFSIK